MRRSQDSGQLLEENARLNSLVKELEAKIAFFFRNSTLSKIQSVKAKGLKIEVKYASTYIPNKVSDTKRWNWHFPTGKGNSREYDRLILIAEVDQRYAGEYRDKGSKYVIFDIPYGEIFLLTCKRGNLLKGSICLTTNPNTAKSRSSLLFTEYQITEKELRARYEVG